MATSAELLCDRSWRLRTSLWILPIIVLAGTLAAFSFLYVGVRAKVRSWLVLAGVFGVLNVATFVMQGIWDDGQKGNTGNENIPAGIGAVAFVGALVAALLINKQWLTFRAEEQGTTGPATAPAGPAPTAPLDAAVASPHAGTFGAPAPAAAPSPTPAPAPAAAPAPAPAAAAVPAAPPVDLNTASEAQLRSDLGLAAEWAAHVVAVRAHVGGFRSPDQLMSDASLPPHVYAGLRDRVVVGAPESPAGPPTGGRRLEL